VSAPTTTSNAQTVLENFDAMERYAKLKQQATQAQTEIQNYAGLADVLMDIAVSGNRLDKETLAEIDQGIASIGQFKNSIKLIDTTGMPANGKVLVKAMYDTTGAWETVIKDLRACCVGSGSMSKVNSDIKEAARQGFKFDDAFSDYRKSQQ
jgi:hypothetical protein